MLKVFLKFLIAHQVYLRTCLCPLLKYGLGLNWQIPSFSTILGDNGIKPAVAVYYESNRLRYMKSLSHQEYLPRV